MQQYMWVGSIWAQCWSVPYRVPFALYLDDGEVLLPTLKWKVRIGPSCSPVQDTQWFISWNVYVLNVLWNKHGLICVQDWMTTVRLLLLLLSSSMSAHRTSHLTSLVLIAFLTASSTHPPTARDLRGPWGWGGVVKYDTLTHTCMHLPVLHPSGSFPTPFPFLYPSAHIP